MAGEVLLNQNEESMALLVSMGSLLFRIWSSSIISGAPNENIVQNHLNIALLNVFKYLNGRYRHIFVPQNFSSVRIS